MATTDEVFKHYQEGVTHERKRCLKAVKAAPELPGDMPPKMAKAIANAIKNGDEDFLMLILLGLM